MTLSASLFPIALLNRITGEVAAQPPATTTVPQPVISSSQAPSYQGIWFTLGQLAEHGGKHSRGLGNSTATSSHGHYQTNQLRGTTLLSASNLQSRWLPKAHPSLFTPPP